MSAERQSCLLSEAVSRIMSESPETIAMRETILYTRQGCHLCDDAHEILVRYGLAPKSIDIDADPKLAAKYTECVPVVVIDGHERFRGRVNEVLLRRLLSGR